MQLSRPAAFLFATEDGTISGWNPTADATHAIRKVDNSAGAKFESNTSIAPVTLSNAFQDSTIPSGFAPFGIQNIGGKLWVT